MKYIRVSKYMCSIAIDSASHSINTLHIIVDIKSKKEIRERARHKFNIDMRLMVTHIHVWDDPSRGTFNWHWFCNSKQKKSLILFTPFGDRDPNPAENVGD